VICSIPANAGRIRTRTGYASRQCSGHRQPRRFVLRASLPQSPVVTVCEALQSQLKLNSQSVVIVGILMSGNNATLRQDCPNHLVTDEIAWPSAISVVGATPAPKGMRRQVENKRSLVLATGSRESSIPAERVVGLYGRFVIPEGFATADSAATNRLHEMAMAPAALFGSAELHFRAISVDAAKTR
jgi:hypothetical protein